MSWQSLGASLLHNLIKRLVPQKGFLWSLIYGSQAELFLRALSVEPTRAMDYLKEVVAESNPGTAVETQEEWYSLYDIKYNETKSLAEKQAETLERYIALGDQDIVYLQDQVNKAGFAGITIEENLLPEDDQNNECGVGICGESECGGGGIYGDDWIFYFYVRGEVDTDSERTRLEALIQRLSPGHTIPIYIVASSNNVCGIAVCGIAVCDG